MIFLYFSQNYLENKWSYHLISSYLDHLINSFLIFSKKNYRASLWWRHWDIFPVLFSPPPLCPASVSWRLVRMLGRGSCLSRDLTSSWRTEVCAPCGQARVKSSIRGPWEPWSDPPRWIIMESGRYQIMKKYWGPCATVKLCKIVESWGRFILTAYWGHFAPSLWTNKHF